MSVAEVTDLRVELTGTGAYVVDGINFSLEAGEVTALVGESGSGKTTIGMSMLGEARRGARIASGSIRIAGEDVVPAPREGLQGVRGRVVAYVPQDPAAALNPAMRVGAQISEALAAHGIGRSKTARAERVRELLTEVKLASDDDFLARYPHQLSGGQQQRVCMAIAISCEPRVLVLDEPTTGLDVTTQAHVLRTLSQLVNARGISALYVTHDLAVVANLAQRVMVLYSGRVVESGPRAAVFAHPAHPYTRRLLAAIPDVAMRRQLESIPGHAPSPSERLTGCSFRPRCKLSVPACEHGVPEPVELARDHLSRCVRAHELVDEPAELALAPPPATTSLSPTILAARDVDVHFGDRQVLHSASFELRVGECLALVGESGSGKTTLSRAVVGLTPSRTGEIRYRDHVLPSTNRNYPTAARQAIQYIFQSPYNALNPRRQVGAILGAALEHFFDVKGIEARKRIVGALERVALPARTTGMYPAQLSGGERQRVAIARALVCRPEILLCDEITSALDVSVQASIVSLLRELQREEHLSLLFVTHNIGLVRSIADRVMVMNQGRVVETGASQDVLDAPTEEYTRTLVADTPALRA
ncbi:MAG: peptide transporter ATP-binding protein [Conexibacter sp.]|nr:peptide transporter ATP-binding protein [Conexibacter sp.]